jgi:hypothetical protein
MGFLESGPLQTNEGLKKEIYCRKNGTAKGNPPLQQIKRAYKVKIRVYIVISKNKIRAYKISTCLPSR